MSSLWAACRGLECDHGSKVRTNTEYERLALGASTNLSDGHARSTLTFPQRQIVERAGDIFKSATATPVDVLESEFVRLFFEVAGQKVEPEGVSLSYSASCATKLLAEYCRRRSGPVYLIEPCFDNIRHILTSANLQVTSVPEEDVLDARALSALASPGAVLWLVLPNNPTGFILDEERFRSLVALLKDRDCLLVIDFCFRFFSDSLSGWCQYTQLRDSGVQFACIEDTGKTWGAADVKVALTVCARSIYDDIRFMHHELLLAVSPFSLSFIAEFMRNSLEDGLWNSVRAPVETNRQVVHRLVERGQLVHRSDTCRNVPLEFLMLPRNLKATCLWTHLQQHGVHILPGHNYFWTDRYGNGESSFRIALARPRREIERAVRSITHVLALDS